MKNIKLARENIKEALYGKYVECKDDEKYFGPVNGYCKVCGEPIRNREGYVCCKCGWEFDIFVDNEDQFSTTNFNLTVKEYRKLYEDEKLLSYISKRRR